MKFRASITTISSLSFKAIGLKFGMKIHLINAVKLVAKFLNFCLGAEVIEFKGK